MTMNDKYRAGAILTLRVVLLSGVAIAVIGCQSIREAAGVVKTPPDEFAVVTKAPLVIPPNFNLRPPKPGAAPTNQSSATDSAQTALFGDDPATIAASLPNTYSPEEKTLLATTGAATADHGIRQQISADAKAMETASPSFTDQLLFRGPPDPNVGHPVDADSEHDRMAAARTAGQSPVEGQSADNDRRSGDESATISKDGQGDKVDTGGWFGGGWFDGIF
jgi:hypothetical protein